MLEKRTKKKKKEKVENNGATLHGLLVIIVDLTIKKYYSRCRVSKKCLKVYSLSRCREMNSRICSNNRQLLRKLRIHHRFSELFSLARDYFYFVKVRRK